MYPLERGHIRIAGTDIASFTLQSLRSRIAVVDQDPALFDATIQDNILVGRLEATTEEVARVCELAGLTDTIHRFPDGLNTVVGERGARLSGGERQRIALARALIKKAPLLVLDEATAALDSLTEQAVVDHLRDALSDCTVVWVTHRLSIIRFVDTVAVMEEGRIVELGSHRDLIRKNGLYTSFVEAQRLPD
jgi:ATP-binding cassette subfamily B protein